MRKKDELKIYVYQHESREAEGCERAPVYVVTCFLNHKKTEERAFSKTAGRHCQSGATSVIDRIENLVAANDDIESITVELDELPPGTPKVAIHNKMYRELNRLLDDDEKIKISYSILEARSALKGVHQEAAKNEAYFEKNKNSLLKRSAYKGKYVAVLNQKIVGCDKDNQKLARRIYAKYGEEYKKKGTDIPFWMGLVSKD